MSKNVMSKNTLNSSVVKAMAYDSRSKQLTIEYPRGIYMYSVPPQVYTQLRKAESLGKEINKSLIPFYDGEKIA